MLANVQLNHKQILYESVVNESIATDNKDIPFRYFVVELRRSETISVQDREKK